MDNTTCHILLLPLEIRQKIYSLCLDDERPQPGLLQLNRSIHNEATHFVRKWNHTYSYNISARGAGFDDSAKWRFEVKRHVPRLSRMKHIIVNIEPPRFQMPLDMWNIWHFVQDFCKKLATHREIQRLTINFVEIRTAQWESDGVPHSSWDFGYAGKAIDGFDVGQLLITFGFYVNNVLKPKLNIPGTYMIDFCDGCGDTWIDRIEGCMTGLWEDDEAVRNYFELMEADIKFAWPQIQSTTSRRSVAAFREIFGSKAILGFQDLKRFKEEWPFMDDTWAIGRPRYRIARHPCCQCGQMGVEVSMPNPYWLYQDLALAEDWHREEFVMWDKRSRCSDTKKFPAEEDTERMTPRAQDYGKIAGAWVLSAKSAWSISATSSGSISAMSSDSSFYS